MMYGLLKAILKFWTYYNGAYALVKVGDTNNK